ncbi:hypothetical protein KW803_00770 [Candidatus Saccharibacteria bacterium]|nr:hypothetical protein [Candidatus Saccharibacteria bacterium]
MHQSYHAKAASSSASKISVRPFLQELKLNPGQPSAQYDLIVANDSTQAQEFNISAVNFGSLDETGGLAFEGSNSIKIDTYGLAKWIGLSQDSFQLESGQQATVRVSVNNDTNLTPGAHYAAIITSAKAQDGSSQQQLSVNPKVSSLLFITKLGGEKYDIHLESISHNGTFWSVPTAATIRIKSTGNTYIVPRGIIKLNQNDLTISKGIINPQSSIVLPRTTRSFEVPLNPLSKHSSGWFFTIYKLQVDYRYDGIDHYATKTIDVRVLNKRSLIALLWLIILVLVIKRLFIDNQNLRKRIKPKSVKPRKR